jgi:hypothetical protein
MSGRPRRPDATLTKELLKHAKEIGDLQYRKFFLIACAMSTMILSFGLAFDGPLELWLVVICSLGLAGSIAGMLYRAFIAPPESKVSPKAAPQSAPALPRLTTQEPAGMVVTVAREPEPQSLGNPLGKAPSAS